MPTEYSRFLTKSACLGSPSVFENKCAANATIQLNAYLAQDAIKFENLENPITYWRNYQPCELRELALKYLIVPATSVSSEKTASAINTRRSNLTLKQVEQLVFINKNSYLLDLR